MFCRAFIADTDSAGPASATNVWDGNPTFVFITKADPEILKEWNIWNYHIVYPQKHFFAWRANCCACNRKNETNSLLCQQSMKKCNFILLIGTGKWQPSSSDLLQRCEPAHLSPAFINMLTTWNIQSIVFFLLTVCLAESRHVLTSFHSHVCMDVTKARWLHNN